MSKHSSSDLPEGITWRFDRIRESGPERAEALEKAGSPSALMDAIVGALEQALVRDDLRWGREQKRDDAPDDCRAVIQFPVNPQLFDWFFNARTGYRAHFRLDWKHGLMFNEQIIEAVRRCLEVKLPNVVTGRQLKGDFADSGQVEIPKRFLMDSLVPHLSKIWFCGKLIGRDGGIQGLGSGGVGPRILLEGEESWPTLYREDKDAWLDIKGAFLGRNGPYPATDPISRAKKLQATGTV
jgi:hypothetical protein